MTEFCEKETCKKVFKYSKEYAQAREFLAFTTNHSGELTREMFTCLCSLRGKGFRWMFKNVEDMEKFIERTKQRDQMFDQIRKNN